MKYSLLYIALLISIILGSSCRKDFNYQASTGNLSFSKDTIYLDTVFATLSSSTYGFKVYNKSNSDVEIPTIKLAKGLKSNYRLNVDGMSGKSFSNIPLFAKDSLYIFIEITPITEDSDDNEFLDTDAILFDTGMYEQSVALVTLIKDAVFLYPALLPNGNSQTIVLESDTNGVAIRSEGFELTEEQLHFTNNKPYVIYGYALVPKNKTLQMDPGTRVHFHKNSGILVQKEGTLLINGAVSASSTLLENEVIFEGDRLEPTYSNIPGQWGTIWIAEGSINNTINHATIKNATIGLIVEGMNNLTAPTLTLQNSQIYNSQQLNLLAIHAKMEVSNSVIANAGHTSVHLDRGGAYSFKHNTIANYWASGFRTGVALKIDNLTTTEDNTLKEANFINCIIDGNNTHELQLLASPTGTFQFKFTNCLLKFATMDGTNEFYDFENDIYYSSIILNGATNFQNPFKNGFRLTNTSAALNNAEILTAQEIPFDIHGNDRTNAPDIGAHEYVLNN